MHKSQNLKRNIKGKIDKFDFKLSKKKKILKSTENQYDVSRNGKGENSESPSFHKSNEQR